MCYLEIRFYGDHRVALTTSNETTFDECAVVIVTSDIRTVENDRWKLVGLHLCTSPLSAHRDVTVDNQASKECRRAAALAEFAGQTATPQNVQRFYRSQGWEVTRQTVHRDLRELERSGTVKRSYN